VTIATELMWALFRMTEIPYLNRLDKVGLYLFTGWMDLSSVTPDIVGSYPGG